MAIELNGVGNSLNSRVRGGSEHNAARSGGTPATTSPLNHSARQDHVQFSHQAQRLLAADHSERFDEQKVVALRQQIEEGRYQVDPQQLAARLLQFEAPF